MTDPWDALANDRFPHGFFVRVGPSAPLVLCRGDDPREAIADYLRSGASIQKGERVWVWAADLVRPDLRKLVDNLGPVGGPRVFEIRFELPELSASTPAPEPIPASEDADPWPPWIEVRADDNSWVRMGSYVSWEDFTFAAHDKLTLRAPPPPLPTTLRVHLNRTDRGLGMKIPFSCPSGLGVEVDLPLPRTDDESPARTVLCRLVISTERAIVCPKCGKIRPEFSSDLPQEEYQARIDGYMPCCNPDCKGEWGTGCWHCHHPSNYKDHAPDEGEFAPGRSLNENERRVLQEMHAETARKFDEMTAKLDMTGEPRRAFGTATWSSLPSFPMRFLQIKPQPEDPLKGIVQQMQVLRARGVKVAARLRTDARDSRVRLPKAAWRAGSPDGRVFCFHNDPSDPADFDIYPSLDEARAAYPGVEWIVGSITGGLTRLPTPPEPDPPPARDAAHEATEGEQAVRQAFAESEGASEGDVGIKQARCPIERIAPGWVETGDGGFCRDAEGEAVDFVFVRDGVVEIDQGDQSASAPVNVVRAAIMVADGDEPIVGGRGHREALTGYLREKLGHGADQVTRSGQLATSEDEGAAAAQLDKVFYAQLDAMHERQKILDQRPRQPSKRPVSHILAFDFSDESISLCGLSSNAWPKGDSGVVVDLSATSSCPRCRMIAGLDPMETDQLATDPASVDGVKDPAWGETLASKVWPDEQAKERDKQAIFDDWAKDILLEDVYAFLLRRVKDDAPGVAREAADLAARVRGRTLDPAEGPPVPDVHVAVGPEAVDEVWDGGTGWGMVPPGVDRDPARQRRIERELDRLFRQESMDGVRAEDSLAMLQHLVQSCVRAIYGAVDDIDAVPEATRPATVVYGHLQRGNIRFEHDDGVRATGDDEPDPKSEYGIHGVMGSEQDEEAVERARADRVDAELDHLRRATPAAFRRIALDTFCAIWCAVEDLSQIVPNLHPMDIVQKHLQRGNIVKDGKWGQRGDDMGGQVLASMKRETIRCEIKKRDNARDCLVQCNNKAVARKLVTHASKMSHAICVSCINSICKVYPEATLLIVPLDG